MSKSDLEDALLISHGPLWYNMVYEKVFHLRAGKAPIRVWKEDFEPGRDTEPVQGVYVPYGARASYYGRGQVASEAKRGISQKSTSEYKPGNGLGARTPKRTTKDCKRVCPSEFRQNSGLAKSKPGKATRGQATKRGHQKDTKGGEWWGSYARRMGNSDKRNVWLLHLLRQNGEDGYRSLCSHCARWAHGNGEFGAMLCLVQFEEKQP